MSLNKRLCLSSDSLNRQSFNERICDDLCELILQYLTLEDKLRLECVCKQFQKTVFKRQNVLKFRTVNQTIPRIEKLLLKNNCFDLKSLESLLKKCPNVTSFQLLDGCDNYNQFIDLITKYYESLDEFRFTFRDITETAFRELTAKFGPNLRAIDRVYAKTELDRLKNFPNLKVLELYLQITNEVILNISGLKFTELKVLRVCSNGGEEMFVKNVLDNFKTVRYLTLCVGNLFYLTDPGFNHISILKELIYLKINAYISDRNLFFEVFKQMADNCLKLKSIDFRFDIWQKGLDLRQFLSPLTALKHLKRLKLRFSKRKGRFGNNLLIFSFEAFEGFSNLTHLKLEFNKTYIRSPSHWWVDEKVLTNIDINLPNLQYLKIEDMKFHTQPAGITQMADILSRLSKLKSIELKVTTDSIGEQLSKELLEKCKRIRSVVVKTK